MISRSILYINAIVVFVAVTAMATGQGVALSEKADREQFWAEYQRVTNVYRSMIVEIESAKSADQWDEKYHKIQNFISNPGSDKYSHYALCEYLKTIDAHELEYIGSIIDSGVSKISLKACRDELIKKIDSTSVSHKMIHEIPAAIKTYPDQTVDGYPKHQIDAGTHSTFDEKFNFSISLDYQMQSDLNMIRRLPFEEREVDPNRMLFSNQGFADKEVMLTFDDGPRQKTTPVILAALSKAGVKAAFFNTGISVSEFPEVARRILAEGHVLGSHTYYHTLMMGREINRGKMSYDQFLSELISGHLAVHAASRYIDPFFRFPNGCSNKNMVRNVSELGLKNFRWSIDSEDWQFSRGEFEARRQNILRTFVAGLKASHNRGIILMHDIHQQTVDALPLILNYLSENGFKVVLLKPANRNVAPGQNLPVVAQGEDYLKQHGMTYKDIRPQAPRTDAKGNAVLDVRFKADVDFYEMFPQLTYDQTGYDAKATCDDR